MTARDKQPVDPGVSDFEGSRARGDALWVSEKFVSLQGEGVSAGVPTGFLRLGRCNLACSWCDTPYSWDFERFDFEREISRESFASLADWAKAECPGRLVITGGEPLVQQKALEAWLPLLDAATGAERLTLEVETNGTILPRPSLLGRIDQWNVSPKLPSSGEARGARVRPNVLSALAQLGHAYFKFVVADAADEHEALGLVDELSLPRGRVLFMPEARSASELRERSGWVAERALASGVRYSGRLHLELYGGRRGT